jgi:hypothetical protein
MGWLEFRGWLRELNRQRAGQDVDAESWKGRENDPWWREQDAIRRRRSGV